MCQARSGRRATLSAAKALRWPGASPGRGADGVAGAVAGIGGGPGGCSGDRGRLGQITRTGPLHHRQHHHRVSIISGSQPLAPPSGLGYRPVCTPKLPTWMKACGESLESGCSNGRPEDRFHPGTGPTLCCISYATLDKSVAPLSGPYHQIFDSPGPWQPPRTAAPRSNLRAGRTWRWRGVGQSGAANREWRHRPPCQPLWR